MMMSWWYDSVLFDDNDQSSDDDKDKDIDVNDKNVDDNDKDGGDNGKEKVPEMTKSPSWSDFITGAVSECTLGTSLGTM